MDWDFFRGVNDYHERLTEEFLRLASDAPHAVAKDDRVVVAAGLVGRGHPWVRCEAVVLEVAQTSVNVRFVGRQNFDGTPDDAWIHSALITDVLPQRGGAA